MLHNTDPVYTLWLVFQGGHSVKLAETFSYCSNAMMEAQSHAVSMPKNVKIEVHGEGRLIVAYQGQREAFNPPILPPGY